MTTGAITVAAIGRTDGLASWLGLVSAFLILVVLMAAAVWLAVWAARGWEEGEDDSDDSGGGGGGRGTDPVPPHRSPDADPEWWLEFERQVAAHVKRRVIRQRWSEGERA